MWYPLPFLFPFLLLPINYLSVVFLFPRVPRPPLRLVRVTELVKFLVIKILCYRVTSLRRQDTFTRCVILATLYWTVLSTFITFFFIFGDSLIFLVFPSVLTLSVRLSYVNLSYTACVYYLWSLRVNTEIFLVFSPGLPGLTSLSLI